MWWTFCVCAATFLLAAALFQRGPCECAMPVSSGQNLEVNADVSTPSSAPLQAPSPLLPAPSAVVVTKEKRWKNLCNNTFLAGGGVNDTVLTPVRAAAARWSADFGAGHGRLNEDAFPAYWHTVRPTVPCGSLRRYGGRAQDGDGGKWLCGLDQLQPGCVIYSLGSNADFSFEDDMLRSTPCRIETFDCTVEASRLPAVFDPRVTFHAVCLADRTYVDSNGRSFATLPALAAQMGHTRIDLLKVRRARS